jgi:hypothetical protein
MEHGQSNEAPLIDEQDTQSDTPMPSRVVTECDDATSLQKITDKASLIKWADETVSDIHIGKRKQKTIKRRTKKKKQNRVLASQETPSPEGSPKYQKSNLSSSATGSNDGRDGGDQYRIEPSGGAHSSQVTNTI